MADSDYGAPQAEGGGIGDYFADHPWAKWAVAGAAVLVVYWLYKRRSASTSTGASGLDAAATTSYTGGIDPNTGLPTQSYAVNPITNVPINPSTGQDFGQIGSASGSLSTWITSAYNALIASGAHPTAADSALYNFVNGQPLSTSEQGLIDTAQGSAGMPPGGPFPIVRLQPPDDNGDPVAHVPGDSATNPPIAIAPPGYAWVWNGSFWTLVGSGPTPQPTPTPTPTPPGGGTGSTPPSGPPAFKPPAVLSAMQTFVNNVYANMHDPAKAAAVVPANKLLAEADVKSGKAYLPTGYTAPTGYVLNPTTRILTKAA